jgi:CubicO group peptidase (beta-lactamase class C family)
MRTPTVLTDGTSIDYGLGTRLGSLQGHRVVGHTGGGGGFGNVLISYPDDHLTVSVLTNTGSSAGTALGLATAIARPMLGLPEKKLADTPVPPDELVGLTGIFESDEGTIENFAKDGKIHFRNSSNGAEGVLLRQDKNIFALTPDIEIHLLTRNNHAQWGLVYTGGLFMDAARRIR